jgi:GT2 family glycosyltransferase
VIENALHSIGDDVLHTDKKRVGVVIVNWNGGSDTVRCVGSLRGLDYSPLSIVIVDNDSDDDSVTLFEREFSSDSAERGISRVVKDAANECITWSSRSCQNNLHLIKATRNLGFAGACNLGADYAMRALSCTYCWFLNNDTLVDPSALSELVKALAARSDCGICGSRLHEIQDTDQIQAQGGCEYDWWRARGRSLGRGLKANQRLTKEEVERRMAYVSGASMLVRSEFIRDVGPMSEEYFLYFEEMDWSVRGRRKGYSACYADRSIVLHREGASIGSSSSSQKASPRSLYYLTRARLRFSCKHAPWTLPTVMLTVLRAYIGYSVQGDRDRAMAVRRGAVDFVRGAKGSI